MDQRCALAAARRSFCCTHLAKHKPHFAIFLRFSLTPPNHILAPQIAPQNRRCQACFPVRDSSDRIQSMFDIKAKVLEFLSLLVDHRHPPNRPKKELSRRRGGHFVMHTLSRTKNHISIIFDFFFSSQNPILAPSFAPTNCRYQ